MVLSAAENIVINHGIEALTVRKIAVQIGYTVGSIYMVFDNMADLIMHVNARTLDHIALQLRSAHDTPEASRIEAFAIAYFNYAQQNFNRWSLVFDYRLPEDTKIPEWYQAKVDAIFSLVEAQFADFARDCSEDQKNQAARTLWAGVHGVCVLSLKSALDRVGVTNVEASVVLLVRNFLRGWIDSVNNEGVSSTVETRL